MKISPKFEFEISCFLDKLTELYPTAPVRFYEHSAWSQKHYNYVPQWQLLPDEICLNSRSIIVIEKIVDYFICLGLQMDTVRGGDSRTEAFTVGELRRMVRLKYLDEILADL